MLSGLKKPATSIHGKIFNDNLIMISKVFQITNIIREISLFLHWAIAVKSAEIMDNRE